MARASPANWVSFRTKRLLRISLRNRSEAATARSATALDLSTLGVILTPDLDFAPQKARTNEIMIKSKDQERETKWRQQELNSMAAVRRAVPVLGAANSSLLLAFGFLLPALQTTFSETAVLRPTADTTLFESSPNDNMGGWTHIAAGTTGSAGDRTRNRGLFRFDVAAALPSQSKITSATLALRVVRVPGSVGGGGPVGSTFVLHRLMKPWGEGDKLGDRGFPADPGEATWNSRFAPESNGARGSSWNVPGAASGADFSAVVSASRAVSGLGRYEFASSSNLVADVQAWLDDPSSNFGWLLKTQSEGIAKTARAFASREDTNQAPILTIEYSPPPRVKIERIERVGNDIHLQFPAEAGSAYIVQYRESWPSNSWLTLTNFAPQPASTNLLIRDPIGDSRRFYRIAKP